MLNITSIRRSSEAIARRPRVAIVAGRDRRAVVKRVLGNSGEIVAELESDARVYLVRDLRPDIVFIDTESRGVNPFTASNRLMESGIDTRIVLLCRDEATAAQVRRRIASGTSLIAVHPYDAASALPASRATRPPQEQLVTHAAA